MLDILHYDARSERAPAISRPQGVGEHSTNVESSSWERELQLSPLVWPPTHLADFPHHQLLPTDSVVRIHRHDRGPWWFSHDGSGRFDLAAPSGTCYFAVDELGAFLEVFRDMRVIPDVELLVRRTSTVHVSTLARLADCTSPAAASFGITAAIHATEDYVKTQTWAGALAAAGFAGVRYLISHDPAQRNVGIALFGPAGSASRPVDKTDFISPRVISAAERVFGYRIIPIPGR
jgi:hypothetical protein